ncbi:hypothetical protein EDF72_4347 [Delftia acidovorans]|nr:hypothetical protein EDF72_4347 [Delftia acidovorans]
MQTLVRMTTSMGTTRDIVQIVHTTNIERYMLACFNKCQIASRIFNLGQIDNLAVL